MQTLHSQLPDSILALIKEYNTCSKFNTFLYDNPDCDELFKTYEPKEGEPYWKSRGDRDQFITRCNQIEKELIPTIIELYHGRQVEVHLPTHTYSRGDGTEGVIGNGVSLRGLKNGNALDEQTIALWVDTGDKFSTHLYAADMIWLIDQDEIDQLDDSDFEEVDTPETDIYAMRRDLNGNER